MDNISSVAFFSHVTFVIANEIEADITSEGWCANHIETAAFHSHNWLH